MSRTKRPKAPDGYRVMLGKNVPKPCPEGMYTWNDGDSEWQNSLYNKGWQLHGSHPADYPMDEASWYAIPDTRKTKPAKQQPDAKGWIPHVPGDEMPCDGSLEVEVKLANGSVRCSKKAMGFLWGESSDEDGAPLRGFEIIAWRLSRPAVKPEPTIKESLTVQIGGDHYKDLTIQPVEFITKNKLPFLEGCVLKRLCRHKAKNGAEDIRKAIHELQLILELEYNEKP